MYGDEESVCAPKGTTQKDLQDYGTPRPTAMAEAMKGIQPRTGKEQTSAMEISPDGKTMWDPSLGVAVPNPNYQAPK